jgi:hypothetical protein
VNEYPEGTPVLVKYPLTKDQEKGVPMCFRDRTEIRAVSA